MPELRDYSGLTLEEFTARLGEDVGRQEALIHLHPRQQEILEAERRSHDPWYKRAARALGLVPRLR